MADSKMQYKMVAKRPADLLKAFSVPSGWSKLGVDPSLALRPMNAFLPRANQFIG